MSGDGKDLLAALALMVSVGSLYLSYQTGDKQTALAEKQTALAEEQTRLSGAALSARADVAVWKAEKKQYTYPDALYDADLKGHAFVRLDVTNEGKLQGRLDAVGLDNGDSTRQLQLKCERGGKFVACSTPMPIEAQTTQVVYAVLSDRERDLRCLADGKQTELSLLMWDGTAKSFTVPTGTAYLPGGACAAPEVDAPGDTAESTTQAGTGSEGTESEETADEGAADGDGTASGGEQAGGGADEGDGTKAEEKSEEGKADEVGADDGEDDSEDESKDTGS